MLTETADYEKLYRDFRWEIPARFNMWDPLESTCRHASLSIL